MASHPAEAASLATRLGELKREFEQGQAALAELDRQRQELRDGLLRLAGAIQVLEEFVGGANDQAPADNQTDRALNGADAAPQVAAI